MIAFVFGVIAFSIFSGSMVIVSKSMSTKTGMQLCCRMQVADEDHEYAVTMTSSPVQQPQATMAICSAAVPELVVMACWLPFHAANSFSNATQLGPKAWLAPSSDSMTSLRSI